MKVGALDYILKPFKLSAVLLQAQIQGGSVSNGYQRGYLYWKNGQLYRRDLVGTNGLPAEVRVSSITQTGACNDDDATSSYFMTSGDDLNVALISLAK